MKNTYIKSIAFLLICLFALSLKAQNTPPSPPPFCASREAMQQFLTNPTHQSHQNAIETQIHDALSRRSGLQTRTGVVTLPVVVHIVHNNGAENISDAQVLKGIQDLNDAFANRGYYDPTTGVNTDIQFCLAQRNQNNQPTNGITRDVSPLTNMVFETDDENLKNINRWQTTCFINIWLVKEMTSNSFGAGLAGFAYYPSAHGSAVDGIVMEARWFGSSPANTTILIHEMGHYLGLYHTFEGGCENDNCLTDGDRVCDTPPDQSQEASCRPNGNSCTSDTDDPSVNNPFRAVTLGGRGDVADMGENYMDYSPFACYSIFTNGQKERMNFTIQNIRQSLLACKSCELPCPSPVSASFSPRGQTIDVGNSLSFTSTTTNATTYRWRVGPTNYSTENITHNFNAIGSFKVVLEASNADARCQSASDSVIIQVVCPVKARITPLSISVNPNVPTTFNATVQRATTNKWTVNGIVAGSDTTLTYTFPSVGNYTVQFIASNGICADTQRTTVTVTLDPIALCNNPLYSKDYKLAQGTLTLTALEADKNNTYIGVGMVKVNTTTQSFIIRLDTIGKILWAKRIVVDTPTNTNNGFNPSNNIFYDVKPTRDGGYIAAGSTVNGFPFIVKFSASGDVEWNNYVANIVTDYTGFFNSVVETKDGGFMASGKKIHAFVGYSTSVSIMAKFSPNGVGKWVKRYFGDLQVAISGNDSDEATDGQLISIANTFTTANTYAKGYLIKSDSSNGNIIWQKQYTFNQFTNEGNVFNHVSKTKDGGFLIAGFLSSTAGVFMKVDKDGNPVFAKTIKFDRNSFGGYQALETPDSGYLLAARNDAGVTRNVIIKLDRNFNIEWKKFMGLGTGALAKGAIALDNGGFCVGYNQTFGGFSVSKTTALAESCEDLIDSYAIFEDVAVSITSNNLLQQVESDFRKAKMSVFPLPITQTSRCTECKEICNNGIDDDNDGLIDEDDVVDCPCRNCFIKDTLKIVGADTVCIGSNVVYTIKSKCTRLTGIGFLFKAGALPVAAFNDSTFTFRATTEGDYILRFSNLDSCNRLSVAKNIHVISPIPVLELGSDKSVCRTGVFTFNAKRGFKSYRWQDGSTDSTFTAFGIGKYWVQVVDSCGGVQSDTVRVTQTPSPSFSISPDTFRICEGGSIVVNAPTGFATYRWSPSAGVNDTFQRRITLTPSVSGTYFCVAATAQGCVNEDSIWVDVKPLTRLTRNIALCGGNYKIGDSTFTKSGNYTIILRGRSAACDTVVALTLTITNLSIQTTITNSCPNQRNGRIVALSKNGTLPYRFKWNTGETRSELTNLAAGTYRLTVTDANNCTDTISAVIKATPQYPYTFSVKTPRCFGDATGEIRLNSTAQLSLSLDSTATNKTGLLNNLRAGDYTIFVKDSNNCLFSEKIILTQPPQVDVVLQADTIIKLGDSLKIKPIVSGGGRLTYRWQPPQFLNCDTCSTVIARPTTGILYNLVVMDSANCSATDKLLIEVKNACAVFVPNVFSPFSSLGTNAVFYPFGDNCAQNVVIMQVYDRWGELVFEKTNFPLNDATFGWDGRYKGQELNPAVFTYRIDIQLINGRIERFSGDVTLLR